MSALNNTGPALRDGLILRLAQSTDGEAIYQLVEDVFYKGLAQSVREIMAAQHGEFYVIEDTAQQQIAAITGLIPCQWQYGEQVLDVGRLDVVGTQPDYRQQGLSRVVIDACHALSQSSGHHCQIVEGVPWYYRKFGYEYAVSGVSELTLSMNDLPPAASEYHIRPATVADVPLLVELYNRQCQPHDITQKRDETFFEYQLSHNLQGALAIQLNMVLDETEKVVGYFGTWADKPYGQIILRELGVVDTALYSAVLKSVLQHMRTYFADNRALFDDDFAGEVYITLGENHPAIKFVASEEAIFKSEYWYVRVANWPHFLNHVRPVLNKRLQQSSFKAYTGDLKISLYTKGIQLSIVDGAIQTVEAWQPPDMSYRTAAFPDQTFSKLVFGHRSLAEIQHMYPDCRVDASTAPLLGTLFPPQSAWVIY